MGIQGYYEWIQENYPYASKTPKKIQKYDHVLIDLNFILHNAMHNSKSEKGFIIRICKSLDFLFSKFIALHTIYLAIDGAAPYAKIALQRKRRSSIKNSELESEISSLCLTPGTNFMNNLTHHLVQYFKSRDHWSAYRKVRYFISPASDSGEGEIKIFRHINSIAQQHPSDSFLVVGNDADLVVLAMACISVTNIDILIRRDKQHQLFSLEKLLNIHRKKVVSLLYGHSDNIPTDEQLRNDFSVLSMMMGNDYLSRLYYIKVENIWESYFLTKSVHEEYLIKTINGQVQFNTEFLSDMMMNLSLTMGKQYHKMNFYKYSNQNVKSYLEGFLWCLQMYRTGNCSMIDYLYENPPPSPYEVFYYLNLGAKLELAIPTSTTQPVPYYAYGLLVLPRKAKKYIPEKYHQHLNKELDVLYRDEECQDCITYKTNLGTLHREMIKLRICEEDTEDVRSRIGAVSKQLHAHKKEHDMPISISNMVKLILDTIGRVE